MKPTPPVMIWDEDTPREHRATQRVVKNLPAEFRREVARCFIGWHVIVELDDPGAPPVNYNLTGADRWVLKGYVEGVAHSHNRTSDVLLLTLPSDHRNLRPGQQQDMGEMHAYSLATVRSITTLGSRGSQGPEAT